MDANTAKAIREADLAYEPLTPVAILEKARDHIKEVGWHQGNLLDRDQFYKLRKERNVPEASISLQELRRINLEIAGQCRVCANGALNWAGCGNPWGRTEPVVLEAHNALYKVVGPSHVSRWNDDPDRTVDEVIEAFDKAIAMLKAGE